MSVKFDQSVAKMHKLFKVLESKPFLTKDKLAGIPEQGIYVFYEDGKAIYVGRSDHLKRRLKEHSRKSSKNSATLAIKMAKKARRNMPTLQSEKKEPPLKQLMGNEDFKKEFKYAKCEIAEMKIRCVGIPDPIEQALFEIYAHLELSTEFNEFKNT